MNNVLTQITFRSLPIEATIIQGLEEAGYTYCTPIQHQTLPFALQGLDVAGQAQTGTGKTAAFLIAMFQRLLSHKSNDRGAPRGVVLAPTRELAIQIHREAMLLGRHCGLRIGLVYGGADYVGQLKQVKDGLDLLIGTPGRMLDFYKQRAFHLRNVQVVVLDEADQMLDLGFIRDIRYLLRRMPPPTKRQGLLFSATLSFRVVELAYEHMNKPEMIRIEPEQVAADTVEQYAYYPANEQKIPLLIHLMETLKPGRSLIFVNTRRVAEQVEASLNANGLVCGMLTGDVPQPKRQRLLKDFQDDKLPRLVATDVAARGLHIPDVSHVFNYDLPHEAESYVHRIGRTARFGASGDAVSFVCEEYVYSLPEIEAFVGHKIPVRPIPTEQLSSMKLVKARPKARSRSKSRPPGRGQSGSGNRRNKTSKR